MCTVPRQKKERERGGGALDGETASGLALLQIHFNMREREVGEERVRGGGKDVRHSRD